MKSLLRIGLVVSMAGSLPAVAGCGTATGDAADMAPADLVAQPIADQALSPDLAPVAGDMAMVPGKDCRCGDPDCGACPSVKMIRIDKNYEIDATEVTIAAYAEFLAARVTTAGQGKGCEANMSYAPACFDGSPLPGKGYEKHPVSCVDWCDASAYCKWAGKHICLGFLESPLNIDEWDTACEGLGPQPTIYPYGDVYNAQVCNVRGNAAGKGQTWEAGANGCESSHFPGLFDLSGNVAEWSRCSDQEPAFCPLLGGSYLSDASTAGCMPGAETIFAMKNIGLPDVGFRCCR